MRVLITGITGFAGSHLAEYALSQPGVEVYGTVRIRSRLDNIVHLTGKVRLVECDLRDPFAVRSMIAEVRPNRVFHLAAQSFVPASWAAPEETFTTNVLSQINLLEATRQECPGARIQVAGSSEEYGLVYPEETPIREENPLRPLSPYGVSKVAQDLLGWQYHASYGLHIIRTRAFNHTGPRRGEAFATSSFCRQVAEIECGLAPPVLRCGNLEARRDLTDVRDTVRAYWLALEMGEPGQVYNIASGRCVSMREVLDLVLARARCRIKVEVDPARLRPSDVPLLLGDASRLRECTGWVPAIPLEQTLADLLDYWRERVARNATPTGTEGEG
ncbi:MAG: GDP-mannose 4,6-dehydratase [Bacillota bacterium]